MPRDTDKKSQDDTKTRANMVTMLNADFDFLKSIINPPRTFSVKSNDGTVNHVGRVILRLLERKCPSLTPQQLAVIFSSSEPSIIKILQNKYMGQDDLDEDSAVLKQAGPHIKAVKKWIRDFNEKYKMRDDQDEDTREGDENAGDASDGGGSVADSDDLPLIDVNVTPKSKKRKLRSTNSQPQPQSDNNARAQPALPTPPSSPEKGVSKKRKAVEESTSSTNKRPKLSEEALVTRFFKAVGYCPDFISTMCAQGLGPEELQAVARKNKAEIRELLQSCDVTKKLPQPKLQLLVAKINGAKPEHVQLLQNDK